MEAGGSVTPVNDKQTRWKLRVPLGRDQVTGRYRVASRTVTASSRRGATKLLAEWRAELEATGKTQTVATVARLLDDWLALTEGRLSPTTVYTYRGYINRSVLPALGDRPVGDVTARDLDDLYRRLAARGMASASVRQVHAIIRRAYGQAVKWGWVVENPALRASPPPVQYRQLTPPSPEEIRRLVAAAEVDDPQLASLVLAAGLLGARRGELCALRWQDVDLGRRTVTIGRSVVDVGGRVVEKGTKTHAVRVVSIPAALVPALEAQRERVTARAGRLHPGSFVWPHPNSLAGLDPWRPDLVTGAFRRLRAEVGVDARFHDLRHAMATQLLAAGVDVRTVSGRLGHAMASTTLNIYAHWQPAADVEAAEVIGRLLEPDR